MRLALSCLLLLFVSLVAADFDFSGFAPLPDGAQGDPLTGPALPGGTAWRSDMLAPGVYVLREGVYQVLVIEGSRYRGRDCALVLDAPETWAGNDLVEAIKTVTDHEVCTFVYSHAHLDHVGNAHRIKAEWPCARFIGHKETARHIRDRLDKSDTRRPLPTRTFEKRYKGSVGHRGPTFYLHYNGNGHMPGNILFYFPSARVVFYVDTVWPKWVPFDFYGLGNFVPGLQRDFDFLLGGTFNFEYFLGGHFGIGTRDDVVQAREYLTDCLAFAGQGLFSVFQQNGGEVFGRLSQDSGVGDPTATNFGNSFLLFHGAFVEVQDVCEPLLRDKYLGVLAAADVFARSNCYACMQTLRLE